MIIIIAAAGGGSLIIIVAVIVGIIVRRRRKRAAWMREEMYNNRTQYMSFVVDHYPEKGLNRCAGTSYTIITAYSPAKP